MADERPDMASKAGQAYADWSATTLDVTEKSGGDPQRLLALLHEREQDTTSPARVRTGKHRLRVSAVMRPEIDTKRIARALLREAEDQIRRERDDPEAQDEAA